MIYYRCWQSHVKTGIEKAHNQAYRMIGIEMPSGIFPKIPVLRG